MQSLSRARVRHDAEDSGGAQSSTDGNRSSLRPEEATESNVDMPGGEDECMEGEEGRRPVMAPTPQRVSKQEREEHNLTHCPFRAWCRHCVRGRGQSQGHHKVPSDEAITKVPRISMDYHFMSKEDERVDNDPVFTMVNAETNDKYSRVCGRKGLGQDGGMDWLVKDASAELRSWGHAGGTGGSIILKAD